MEILFQNHPQLTETVDTREHSTNPPIALLLLPPEGPLILAKATHLSAATAELRLIIFNFMNSFYF